jgi:hypothetical protein
MPAAICWEPGYFVGALLPVGSVVKPSLIPVSLESFVSTMPATATPTNWIERDFYLNMPVSICSLRTQVFIWKAILMNNPCIRRPYNNVSEPIGTIYHFPGLGNVELVEWLENDYGYCYQGAIVRLGELLYRAEFHGPFEETDDGPSLEEIVLRTDHIM